MAGTATKAKKTGTSGRSSSAVDEQGGMDAARSVGKGLMGLATKDPLVDPLTTPVADTKKPKVNPLALLAAGVKNPKSDTSGSADSAV